MADEPSWDDIFSSRPSDQGHGAATETQGTAGAGRPVDSKATDEPVPGDTVPTPVVERTPLTRRERREQEARAAARPTKAPVAPPVSPQFSPTRPTAQPAAQSGTRPVTPASARTPASAQPPRDTKPPKPPKAAKQRGPRRPHRRGAIILIIVLVIVLGGGTAGGFAVYNQLKPGVSALFGKKAPTDYTGDGNGKEVDFTINTGDIGSTIATNLVKADITKSFTAAYSVLLADQSISFQPGTYKMYQHMSGASAIARLQDTTTLVTNKLVIPEGTTLKGIEALMATATKLPAAQIQAAAADYKAYGLPAGVTSLEGYLFPATYDLQPGKSAQFYFQEMVTTMKQHLASAGVAPANYEHTIVFASLIQKEAGLAADFPKVARVFQNRIDQGMLLQSDATVAYGAGITGRVTTTDAERADKNNKYNTYVYKGLPVGPISNPGDVAIAAAQHPAAGTWLYFVTVNLQTGATVFSTTYAEHQAAVAQFQAWLRANPSYNK